ALQVLLEVVDDPLAVPGVDDDDDRLGERVEDDVVEREALLVDDDRVAGHAGLGARDGLRDEGFEEGRAVLAREAEAAHVLEVEEARLRPHGLVLGDDARVVDGHLPATELDHASPEALVPGVEGRLSHGCPPGREGTMNARRAWSKSRATRSWESSVAAPWA